MNIKRKISLVWACAILLLFLVNRLLYHSDNMWLILILAIYLLFLFIDIFRNDFPKYVYWIAITLISFILFIVIFGTIGIISVVP